MTTVYVLLADSVFTDEDNPLDFTVEGDDVPVVDNIAVMRDVLDEEGNPTGEEVFDFWDLQNTTTPDLWGGIMRLGFFDHPGLGLYWYCVVASSQVILDTLEALKPNDVRFVADYTEFDDHIPNDWRAKLNVFLEPGDGISVGTIQQEAARFIGEDGGFNLVGFDVTHRDMRDLDRLIE